MSGPTTTAATTATSVGVDDDGIQRPTIVITQASSNNDDNESQTYQFDSPEIGGIPNVNTIEAAIHNKDVLNEFLKSGKMKSGDKLVFGPSTAIFYMMGGVEYICDNVNDESTYLDGITFVFDAKIQFTQRFTAKFYWPSTESGNDDEGCCGNKRCRCFCNPFCPKPFKPCMNFVGMKNCIFTSSTKPVLLVSDDDPTTGGGDVTPVATMPTATMQYSPGHGGIIDGGGDFWWGYIRYVIRAEDRPRLFILENCHNMLVENILFDKSPYWTFLAKNTKFLEIQYCKVSNRRRRAPCFGLIPCTTPHNGYQLGAFNTDGFDIGGDTSHSIYIHDVEIWNQDDCIAIKAGSNIVCERIRASGMGLAIGSLGVNKHTCMLQDGTTSHCNVLGKVTNVTFYNCYMEDTCKGIYFKFRDINEDDCCEDKLCKNMNIIRDGGYRDGGGDGTVSGDGGGGVEEETKTPTMGDDNNNNDDEKHVLISDVLCKKITMVRPGVAIWIGPAQQADSVFFWQSKPASILWPTFRNCCCCGYYPIQANEPNGLFRNITLEDIIMDNPHTKPVQGLGVLLGNTNIPMENIQFHNVRAMNVGKKQLPYAYYYTGKPTDECMVKNFQVTGNTWPVPHFFYNDTINLNLECTTHGA